MSIVANYARLTPSQVVELSGRAVADPNSLISSFPGAEVIDVDRAWGPMAWLASSTKRLEDEHNWRVMSAPDLDGAFIAASSARLDATPVDLPLVAIEGRSEKSIEAIDSGMGPAAMFDPAQVQELSSALHTLQDSDLRNALDPERMDEMQVFPGYWREETNLLDTYILPNLRRLREFYATAASSGQAVIVWYT
ncbi:DUF1877 family protein [Xanthomonas dyei]|nr:YfbM family protein [Xanthomonas dyei pv. eucalypti]